MTGFGRATFNLGEIGFEVEVRSVNHRHLDVRVRLPRLLAASEYSVRARVQQRLSRGKVDLTVVHPGSGAPPQRLEIDMAVAEQYTRAAEGLAALPGTLDVATVLALPGVARFVEPELPAAALERALEGAVDTALDALEGMRATEGAVLYRDLSERSARVASLAESLEGRADVVQESIRARLHKRAQHLELETGLMDEARLHQEIVLAADRLDVTEEIVRLRSHVEQFRTVLESGGPGAPVGRQLEFLLQEFGREANTIGSKGSDAPIAHEVVELKTELERIREQVLNVE